MKKIFLETYGCQMNEYDSELVRGILTKDGYVFVQEETAADIVLLNTCAIREHAHRKVFGRIHKIRHKYKQRSNGDGDSLMIGVLGCMATNLRKDLLEDKALKIDFIAGPDSYKRLPGLIREAAGIGAKAFDTTLSEFETYSDVYPSRVQGVNAWVAVMRGCNNFCTFCVVPYTRGRERSRSVANVVEEVKRLAGEGFKQVTFLGQNVNSYSGEGGDFAALLEATSKVNGIERIRFTSPNPKDFPDDLLEVMANNPKVCKHIHLPLQSGNDRMLKLMDRFYTQKEFLDLVDKIRGYYPQMALTSDIIVGFSSETDEEFSDTAKVMQAVEFDAAFIFKYSERKGTIAERKFPDDVPEEKKTARIVQLVDMQKDISLKRNEAHIGDVCNVMIEETELTRSTDKFQGRTDGNKRVIVPAGAYGRGDFVKVKIQEATPHLLKGEYFYE